MKKENVVFTKEDFITLVKVATVLSMERDRLKNELEELQKEKGCYIPIGGDDVE